MRTNPFSSVARSWRGLIDGLPKERSGALVGLSLLVLVFSVFSPPFRSLGNLQFLVQNAAITISLVSLGQTIVMISGGIDFSVSSVIAFTSMVSAILFLSGFGPIPPLTGGWCYLGLMLAWLVGAMIGAAQGWLITRFQIPPFIVTLATALGLRGLTVGISSGQIIYGLPVEFHWLSEGQLWLFPIPFLLILAIYGFTAYMLLRSKVGRYCFAIGGNETAARLAGINVTRYRIMFYAFSSLLAAITGTLLVSHLNAAIYSTGEGYEFSSVAAAIIGGTSLSGGKGGVWGTLIGVAILTVIPSGMLMLNASPWIREVITALVIILAVIIDVSHSRSRKKEVPVESAPVITSLYLSDILTTLVRNIECVTGSVYCRIYLADRDTGELVPHGVATQGNGNSLPLPAGKSPIAAEAFESGRTVIVPDNSHGAYQRIKLINPAVRSALALPFFNQETCLGVVELQCPGVGALKEPTIEIVRELIHPMAVRLEDAWLLESGWLVRQLRYALRHLWDELYLGRSALADWALAGPKNQTNQTAGARGKALHDLLLQSIETLKPTDDQASQHGTQTYRILRLTYVDELTIDLIIHTLHISRRQYFYELKNSMETLVDLMVRNHRS